MCVGLVHVTGKRKLLITTTVTASICLFTLAVYDYIHSLEKDLPTDQTFLSSFRWIPIVFLNANAFFTHAGIRLLSWVLIGEVKRPIFYLKTWSVFGVFENIEHRGFQSCATLLIVLRFELSPLPMYFSEFPVSTKLCFVDRWKFWIKNDVNKSYAPIPPRMLQFELIDIFLMLQRLYIPEWPLHRNPKMK